MFHFYNIFGPELRSIVVDPQRIDSVSKRVEKLVIQIENTDFDIFKESSKENWDQVMDNFYSEVKKLDMEAVNFIDQSFKILRWVLFILLHLCLVTKSLLSFDLTENKNFRYNKYVGNLSQHSEIKRI